jgi:ribosomal RNA assembly protein
MKAIRIPKERVAVLIGTEGSVKRFIEERLHIGLVIDAEGEVTINEETADDPLAGMKAMDIVKAIGRGFSPQNAYVLFDDMEYLEVIDIKEYCGKKPEQLSRCRARVIGSNGKTRRIIETLTGAHLSIYGGTVGIIGGPEQVEVARRAVDMLLRGSEHSTVYRYLERNRARMHIIEMGFEP